MARQRMTPLIADSARAQVLADWQARFERTEQGLWVCPACGDATSEFLLGVNHGYHLHYVPYLASRQFGETCVKLELQAAHALYDSRRAQVRHLIAAGLDDEQIAARVDVWNAQTIAVFRGDEAKAARIAARRANGENVTVGHGSDCPCAYCEGPCDCPSCQEFRGAPASDQVAEQEPGPLTLF